MEVFRMSIEGVLIIETDVFGDPRGYFTETYNKLRYEAMGIANDFVQDNMSFSHKRGLCAALRMVS